MNLSIGFLLSPGLYCAAGAMQWPAARGRVFNGPKPRSTPIRVGVSPAVRYDPDEPEECVLETRRPGPIYLIVALFGFLFVGFGLFWGSMTG